MRAVWVSGFALGLLIVPFVSADAATAHRSRMRAHASASPSEGMAAPAARGVDRQFSVPGWSGRDTERWLDKASSLVGVGG
jgi:hypothetical protein